MFEDLVKACERYEEYKKDKEAKAEEKAEEKRRRDIKYAVNLKERLFAVAVEALEKGRTVFIYNIKRTGEIKEDPNLHIVETVLKEFKEDGLLYGFNITYKLVQDTELDWYNGNITIPCGYHILCGIRKVEGGN